MLCGGLGVGTDVGETIGPGQRLFGQGLASYAGATS